MASVESVIFRQHNCRLQSETVSTSMLGSVLPLEQLQPECSEKCVGSKARVSLQAEPQPQVQPQAQMGLLAC